MTEDKTLKILNRFKKSESRKDNFKELYREAQEYCAPHRETFDDQVEITPGQQKDGRGKVFDSTAIDAVQKFASNLQSSLVPPMQEWIDLKPGRRLKDNKNLAEALAKVQDVMFDAIHNSNFDIQVAESFQDLAIGTGALLVLKGDENKPLRFLSVPLDQLVLEEGPYGRPDAAYRRWRIEARNIEKTWPDAQLSKELKEKIKEKPDDKIRVIEAIVPEEVEITSASGKQKLDGYKYYVITEDPRHMIVERNMRTSPWVIFRWSTLSGETYGRGPALIALPDIKTINKTKELLLKSASISIFGMWTGVDDGTMNLNNIKFSPGTVIPVSSNEGSARGPTLAPLNPPGDPNLAQLIIENLRGQINNMLFADPLGPIDLPVKSATEMSLRQQELSKRIGAAYGRLQFELLQPLINRVLDILDDLGLIDLGDFRVDGNVIAIEHTSPLARAQKEEEAMQLVRFMETIAGFYGPEVLNVAAPIDRTAPELERLFGVKPGIVPSKDEFAKLGEAIAQAAASSQAQQGEIQ